jgi:hypothetical protein
MTTSEDLSLFYKFPLDDQVALLGDPDGRLSPPLVRRLSHSAGSVRSHAIFTSNPSSDTGFVLSDRFKETLTAVCSHLDQWWECLDPEVRDHFIRHRSSGIDGHYKGAVMCAGDGRPDGLIIGVVQDKKTGQFRLPPPIDAYVELQARL